MVKSFSDKTVEMMRFGGIIVFFLGISFFLLLSFPSILFDESALCRIAYFFSKQFSIKSDYIVAQNNGAYWLPPVNECEKTLCVIKCLWEEPYLR